MRDFNDLGNFLMDGQEKGCSILQALSLILHPQIRPQKGEGNSGDMYNTAQSRFSFIT